MEPNVSETRRPRIREVPFDKRFLDLSFGWLHEPETQRLTDSPAFSREEQWEWWNQLDDREDYLIWGIEADGLPVGAFGLKSITDDSAEFFVYVGDPAAKGKGIGSWAISKSVSYMRQSSRSVLRVTVLNENDVAKRLYEKAGFKLKRTRNNRSFYELIL